MAILLEFIFRFHLDLIIAIAICHSWFQSVQHIRLPALDKFIVSRGESHFWHRILTNALRKNWQAYLLIYLFHFTGWHAFVFIIQYLAKIIHRLGICDEFSWIPVESVAQSYTPLSSRKKLSEWEMLLCHYFFNLLASSVECSIKKEKKTTLLITGFTAATVAFPCITHSSLTYIKSAAETFYLGTKQQVYSVEVCGLICVFLRNPEAQYSWPSLPGAKIVESYI